MPSPSIRFLLAVVLLATGAEALARSVAAPPTPVTYADDQDPDGSTASTPPTPTPTTSPAPAPTPTPTPTPTSLGLGLVPGLNLSLPEGQASFRLGKLIKSSFFETQFEYDFVSGDIFAALRYKYYGARRTLTISGFDSLSFRALETVSTDFDRVRGLNVLVRHPVSFRSRFSVLAEVDRLSFSGENKDDQRTNLFVKLGYQYGTDADSRSNEVTGDRTDRIRNLFTAYRAIGPNGRGLSLALTYGTPIGAFNYVKAEGEALQIVDLPRGRRLIGRVHAGFFPYKPYGPPEESSSGKPFLIPGTELLRLDGRDALKGSKTGERGVYEIHFTLEAFLPIFVNRNLRFLAVDWDTLYLVGYAGTGSIGDEHVIYTRLGDYRQDVGGGLEVSFRFLKYQVFVSGLVSRVLQDTGSPKVLLTLRSAN